MDTKTQSSQPSVATFERVVSGKRPLLLDIYLGVVHGDYARQLGVSGHLTQALCSLIPGVGQLCALRDLFADLKKRDGLGVVLNFLALVPVVGGLPKAVRILGDMIRLANNVHESLRPS